MCGNDVSTIVNTSGDFHTIVSPQIPSRRINLSMAILIQRIIHSTKIMLCNSTVSTLRESENLTFKNVESITKQCKR
jgi:hypothetical protein